MNDSSTPGRVDVVVDINRPGGSVEHYHHFLLGLLTPLVVEWSRLASSPEVGRVLVRSCAIFDRLLVEADLPKLTILPKEQHAELLKEARPDAGPVGAARAILAGYDTPAFYDRRVFNQTREILSQRLSLSIDEHRRILAAALSEAGPRIVFIDRGPPDPFYTSDRAEIPTAGAQRRSIANFHDAHRALVDRFGAVLATTLEGRSLAYQIALFQLADIVICQHGAALANLIWSPPTSAIIEIVPRHSPFRRDNKRFRAFRELACCLSLDYRRLKQPSSHGAIDVTKLVDLVAAAVNSFNSRRDRVLAQPLASQAEP